MEKAPPHGFDPIAGLLAAVLPGLGHVYSGRVKRGLLAGGGVLGLFLGGLLIGGVDAIDSEEDQYWFLGQALVGPLSFAVDAWHQGMKAHPVVNEVGEQLMDMRTGANGERIYIASDGFIAPKRNLYPGETRVMAQVEVSGTTLTLPVATPGSALGASPAMSESLSKLNEIAMLYILCAGLCNLIVFLDALMPNLHHAKDSDARKAAKTDPEPAA
ncbi:MAG: DUF6677 family protein [Planctomycetota bacterium]